MFAFRRSKKVPAEAGWSRLFYLNRVQRGQRVKCFAPGSITTVPSFVLSVACLVSAGLADTKTGFLQLVPSFPAGSKEYFALVAKREAALEQATATHELCVMS